MRKRFPDNFGVWLAFVAILCAASAHGATLQVSVQTSSLIGGSYSLIFDLIDGDTLANNTVTLSSFQFGGGGVIGSPTLTGDATGNLGSLATLRDTTFFNEILQAFSAGSIFRFNADTSLSFASGTPDSLSFFFLNNGTGMPIPSLDPSGADSFLDIDLQPSPVIRTFGSDPTRTSLVIPAPQVSTPGGGTVPEPPAIELFGCAILACYVLRRVGELRRKHEKHSRAWHVTVERGALDIFHHQAK